jgi:hypothetical protein
MMPVGRSPSRSAFRSWAGACLYGFCPAWISDPSRAAGPDEPGQSPTRPVSWYSPRLSVVPNAAIPPYPARSPRSFRFAVSLSVSATTRRTGPLRFGLPCGKHEPNVRKCAVRSFIEPRVFDYYIRQPSEKCPARRVLFPSRRRDSNKCSIRRLRHPKGCGGMADLYSPHPPRMFGRMANSVFQRDRRCLPSAADYLPPTSWRTVFGKVTADTCGAQWNRRGSCFNDYRPRPNRSRNEASFSPPAER